VEGLRFEDAEKQHRFEQIDIKAVADQYKEIESIAEGLESKTVLCHCDLLAGNILLPYEVHLATLNLSGNLVLSGNFIVRATLLGSVTFVLLVLDVRLQGFPGAAKTS
jgi:hypothetical protein